MPEISRYSSSASSSPGSVTPGLDPVHHQVGRDPGLPGSEHLPAHPFDTHPERVQLLRGNLLKGLLRDDQASANRPLHDPGGDVDVDAEPVATDALGPAGVDSGTNPGRKAVDLNGFHGVAGRDRGTQRGARIAKNHHHSVTHALDDVTTGVQQWRFGDLSDPTQQPQGRLVARLQRPVREAHQIGEHDRHLGVGRPSGHPFGERLPQLQGGQAHLPGRRVALQQAVRGAGGGLRAAIPGRRQRVTEVGVTGQHTAGATDEPDDIGVAVGGPKPTRDPRRGAVGTSLRPLDRIDVLHPASLGGSDPEHILA